MIEARRVLCIGDGINTDILGAVNEGFDSLFISGGLAKKETATNPQPNQKKLAHFLQSHNITPTATIGHLR